MKIAISTNDGLMIAPVFENSYGFLILTLTGGEIIKEEILRNSQPGFVEIQKAYLQISDCSVIIARDISESSAQFFKNNSIPVIRTKEEIITNILVHYLENEYREASNTCCCP